MDGRNTRSPVSTKAWTQGYEPMRFVRVENAGQADVINPWVLVNGKRNWRTVKNIVEDALRPYGDLPKVTEAGRARAIWDHHRQHRFHASSGDLEVQDPVKMYNIYGYGICGDAAPVLMGLWRQAGLKVRRGFPIGHCISEVWYDGQWHLLDSDMNMIALRRDNETIASEADIAHDHDLIKRTHINGAGQADSRMDDESTASLFVYQGELEGEFASHVGHTMDFILRPGEALEWGWKQAGRHHYSEIDPQLLGYGKQKSMHLGAGWGDRALALVSNGKWIYSPPLRQLVAQQGVTAQNVRWSSKASEPAAGPASVAEPSSLIWKMETPYVLVGGQLRARVRRGTEDLCAFSVSMDGQNWKRVVQVDQTGRTEVSASLDDFFPNQGTARYRYFLRADLLARSTVGSLGLESLTIENDLQMAPLSLPALELGTNTISYSDQTLEPHAVQVTFEWMERSGNRGPVPPLLPVFPLDKTEVEGTQFTFKWEQAQDPDRDAIADYHFQLSREPSMRSALSSNFEKLISNTVDRGNPCYTTPSEGLLNPRQHYFWRVRAKDEKGLWGEWSPAWSFVPQGPAVPLNLKLERGEGRNFSLVWTPNEKGRQPVKYEIHASNEKGFTASDKPYEVNAGNQKDRGLFAGQQRATFPASVLATVSSPHFEFTPRHAFYRVIAVDEKGNQSGASDYAATPRPMIYSEPPTKAKAGMPYSYQVKSISSIGDLGCRFFAGDPASYHIAFWDADKPEFSLVDETSRCAYLNPVWMKMDPHAGLLTGTPQVKDIGEYQVNVMVQIAGVGKAVQSFVVRVGE